MCGIVGIAGSAATGLGEAWVRGVVATGLQHRGPDGSGVWVGENAVLGHTRLAILDLSPAGAQPMASASGRTLLTYNGEVYRADELARRIPGVAWRGHSDTEIIAEHVERAGTAGLEDLHGMFALATWDLQAQRLTLARDRAGIKPLYWAQVGDGVAFSSELAPLCDLQGVDKTLDREALALYLSLGCIPAPWTICQGIRQLEPGYALILQPRSPPRIERFASPLGEPALAALSDPHEEDEALEAAILAAVGDQLAADVPVGVLLSGGVDSGVVAAAAARKTGRIKTFSIVHQDPRYDERIHARAIARHLGTDHTELEMPPGGMTRDELETLVDHHGDPFGDSSSLPTARLARLVREHVTVALSGDGGDEVFAGYPRYWQNDVVRHLARLPGPVRRVFLQGYGAVGPRLASERWRSPLRRVARAMQAAGRGPGEQALSTLTFFWPDEQAELLRPDRCCDADILERLVAARAPAGRDPAEPDACHRLEQRLVLPDDMLTKVDRMSMAASIEIRPPLLDDRIAQFAAGLPIGRKMHGREGKAILRALARRWLPPSTVDRPKMGFALPLLDFGGAVLADATRWALESADSPLRQVFLPEALSALAREFARLGDGIHPEDSAFRRAHRQWLLVVLALSLQRRGVLL
jgi:asparagine synthase (glutamine-hydrolysing)